MSVNVKINDLVIKKPMEISKELEIINFRMFHDTPEQYYLRNDFKSWIVNEFDKDDDKDHNTKLKRHKKLGEKTQFRCFQRTMKLLLAFGQCIALNPVTSILDKDISKIRFKMMSFTFIYTIIIAITHTIAACCSCYIMLQSPVSIRSLNNISFYFGNWCITIMFINIAIKWSTLVKEIFNCNLDEYVDVNVVTTVKRFCIGYALIGLVEQILSILSKVVYVMECKHEHDFYEGFVRFKFPWVFELGASYSVPLGILLQVMNLMVVFKWNYSGAFIVCMSVFLTSILNQINKKIIWAVNNNYQPASIWAKLREDYTRATRLVRLFDEVFSGLILVCISGDLFFICLQLYNCLTNGILPREATVKNCPNYANGPFRGYEHTVYMVYLLVFFFIRFLTVTLVTADVNAASIVPAPALYTLPPSAYTKEVQRFVDQIHGDVVALTGLEFFNITRHIILSAAGTLITYELVLLQFNSDELNNA